MTGCGAVFWIEDHCRPPARPRRACRAARFGFCALALLLAWGCGDGSPPLPPPINGPLRLSSAPDSVAIRPGESAIVAFTLQDENGAPVPERVVQFTIIDDPSTPGDDARGATLSFDRSITNDQGLVHLQIIAGAATIFPLRAAAEGAVDLDVTVFVASDAHAAAEIVPVLEDDPGSAAALSSVQLRFYDRQSCADMDLAMPPRAVRPVRSISPERTTVFSTISTSASHAVLGLGIDRAGRPSAGGCVDLPGRTLLAEATVRVIVPMRVLYPSAAGRYDAISQFAFNPPLKGAEVAAAWKELAECPADPAQLLLDCTLDALSPASAGDPLDCRPDAEGPLGDKLMVRRGARLGATRCRALADGAGRASLEALTAALFPPGRPAFAASLAAIAADAGTLLGQIQLRSTLELTRSPLPDRLLLAHTLHGVDFTVGGQPTPVELVTLGLPAATAAYVPVAIRRDELDIAPHGFTLRLGSAARQAFAQASLRPRGAPTEFSAFASALVAAATFTDKGATVTGCAALDTLLCAEVGEARGCLGAACNDGLAALARRLDAGFRALDGEDLDFFLAGPVPVVDTDGDRRADALGSQGSAAGPGLWSGDIRTRGGTSSFTSVWTASRRP